MWPIKEYEKQSIYILLGLLVLFFPFFNSNHFILALIFLITSILLSARLPGFIIFPLLCKGIGYESGEAYWDNSAIHDNGNSSY